MRSGAGDGPGEDPAAYRLPALAGFTALLRRMIEVDHRPTPDERRARRISALIGLASLLGAVPPDPRLLAIDQVLLIADPRIFEVGPLVEALADWSGGPPEEGLQLAVDAAVARAREVFAASPERELAFANYLHYFGHPDRIRPSAH